MEQEILDKINKLTRREFSENEVYTFSVILCDNDIDRDGERFSDEALEQLQPLFVGKTGIFDHNPSSSNQNARIFDTELVTDPSRRTKYGEVYKYLKACAYMIRTDENKNLIAEIDGGIKKEVSISCSAASRKCSICGCNMHEGNCSHVKGKSYGNELCHIVLGDITDAYEWSFVAVPAQINAGVTKKFKGGTNTMENEFNPITTQAELDAIVSSAVDEAKKQYENWLSPETAAALAQERDDSNAALADMTAKNKAYELNAVKMRVANEKGIPFELAEKISGNTEEEIQKDAEAFAKYFANSKLKPSPRFSGETPFTDSKTASQLEMLREIKNN